MNQKTEEVQFFEYLLGKTQEVFLTSKTCEVHGDRNWNFAVCETPIQKETGVFFGLNWGGDDVETQTDYPIAIKKRSWKFVSHSRRYFRNYLNAEIEQLNYSNICFFRSPEADIIHPDDWELAIPLFKEYIDFINPPWALLLGSIEYLNESHLKSKKHFQVWDKKFNRNVNGYCGRLFDSYPFGSVPHPNARMSPETRNEIWEKVIDEMLKMEKPQ